MISDEELRGISGLVEVSASDQIAVRVAGLKELANELLLYRNTERERKPSWEDMPDSAVFRECKWHYYTEGEVKLMEASGMKVSHLEDRQNPYK